MSNNGPAAQIWVDRFPVDLRRRVKSLAALRGITLRAAVIEATETWCETEEMNNRVEQREG